MSVIEPPFETPPLNHPGLPKLVDHLGSGGSAVSIPHYEIRLPFGYCYWNAARMAAMHGGKIRLGWNIHLWPDRYFSAQHHAVWEDASGVMWEVTAETMPALANHTVFVPDERFKLDLKRVPNVMSRHLPLTRHPRVTAVINAYQAKHAAEARLIKLAYDAGYRCEDQFRIAAGEPQTGFGFSEKQAQSYFAIDKEIGQAKIRLGDAITRLIEWRG